MLTNLAKGASRAKGAKPTVPPLRIQIPLSAAKDDYTDEYEEDMHEGEEGSEDEDVDVAGPSNNSDLMPSLPSSRPSLYLLENAKKKIVLKDGKLVAATKQKAQRKDKGVLHQL